jgi:hypothetical protein
MERHEIDSDVILHTAENDALGKIHLHRNMISGREWMYPGLSNRKIWDNVPRAETKGDDFHGRTEPVDRTALSG